MKKKYTIITIIAVIVLNNFIWYKLYNQEKEKLKHAIIPSLKDDYFTNQLILSKASYNINEYEYSDIMSKYYSRIIYSNITDVPLINQNPDYPNGCEVASATMLLNYFGIDIDMKEYIDSYLPKEEVYEKGGVRYGPNPSISYAGDPSSKTGGWGVFLPVIKNSIYTILKDKLPEDAIGHVITSEDKMPLETYVQNGMPVLVWTTTDYGTATDIYEWFSYDKSKTYTYPKNSHVVVVTGMDSKYYYINDSLKNEKNIKVLKSKLNKSYDSMGRQALFITISEMYKS